MASLLALTTMTAAPAPADPRDAAFATSADPSVNQSFLFSGATIRMPLGHEWAGPRAALRFAGATANRGASSLRIGEGYALSFGRHAKPTLTIGGVHSAVLARRLDMSGGAKAALIVGGVLLVVGAVVAGASDAVDDINDDGGCC